MSRRYDERLKSVKAQLAAVEQCKDDDTKKERRKKAEKQLADLQKDMQKVQLKHKEMEKKEKVRTDKKEERSNW